MLGSTTPQRLRLPEPTGLGDVSRFTAFLDTSVLVPLPLADTLLRLAEAELFRPLWSDAVLAELRDVLVNVHPRMAAGAADRRIGHMTSSFSEACVTGWEALEAGLDLPDPDDRHVLAAALIGRADVIVTANLKHFPDQVLEPLGMTAQGADEFLLNQLDLEPDVAIAALHGQAAALVKPIMAVQDLLERLRLGGAPAFAAEASKQLWRGPVRRV